MRIFSGRDKIFLGLIAVVIVLLSFSVLMTKKIGESYNEKVQVNTGGDHIIKIEKERTFNAVLNDDPVAFFTKWLFVATGLLALFTAGLAIVTIMIWLDGKETSRKQHATTKRSLMHAARSAKAAEDAVANANAFSEKTVACLYNDRRSRIGFRAKKSAIISFANHGNLR